MFSPKSSGNIIYVLEVSAFQGGQILGYVVGQSYLQTVTVGEDLGFPESSIRVSSSAGDNIQ